MTAAYWQTHQAASASPYPSSCLQDHCCLFRTFRLTHHRSLVGFIFLSQPFLCVLSHPRDSWYLPILHSWPFNTYFTLGNAGKQFNHSFLPLPFTFVIYSSRDGHKQIAVFFLVGNSCFRFRIYDSVQCVETACGPYSARIVGFPDRFRETHVL